TTAGSVWTGRPPPGSGFACRGPSSPSTSPCLRRAPSLRAATLRALHSHTPHGYDACMSGYTKDKRSIQSRLSRIHGQGRGIQSMVDEDRYCIDVLTQVNATRAALESVALQLLADHTEHCVTDAIRSGSGSRKIKELNAAVERLVRS